MVPFIRFDQHRVTQQQATSKVSSHQRDGVNVIAVPSDENSDEKMPQQRDNHDADDGHHPLTNTSPTKESSTQGGDTADPTHAYSDDSDGDNSDGDLHQKSQEHRKIRFTETLTFDDVLIIPGHSRVMPHEANVSTRLTLLSTINTPVITSAMDTVTEAKMAIAMAQMGGLGVIHKNLSIEKQCQEVASVKRHEMGMVRHPVTLLPHQTLADVTVLRKKWLISGFPVIDPDTNTLCGVLTERDTRFVDNPDTKVEEMMTKDSLVTIGENANQQEIIALLATHRLERLLVVDQQRRCVGLVTARDIDNVARYPQANKDKHSRLRVAAAISTGSDSLERAQALREADCDILVIDTAHGHSQRVLDMVATIKKTFSDCEVIAGNVATPEATEALIHAGADAVKVGIGPGSICITRIVAGVGIPQLTAIMECSAVARRYGIPVIADGGIRNSGDFAKAIVAGADCCMVGSMLAGTEESPGDIVYRNGRPYKFYRGMGSFAAMARGSADRYFQEQISKSKTVAEGVEGVVPYRGSATEIVSQLVGGLRAAMGYAGQPNISDMQRFSQLCRVTPAGVRESHHHNIEVVGDNQDFRNYS